MFDDILDSSSLDINELEKTDNKPTNSYSNNGNNNYQRKFVPAKKKEEVPQEPYVPVCIFVDREFPPEAKQSLFNIASKLLAKNITVRVNGDDKEFIDKLLPLSDKYLEVYIPWKNFNNIESKHYFNSLTSKEIARRNFLGWEKVPDPVKAILARNVRMIFGDKNNSIVLCVITWSKDGASKVSEVTKETGKSQFIIKTASTYGFPVVNIAKPNAGNILEKTFGI